MNDTREISVVITCYNEIKYIERCLNSVLAQNTPGLRLRILVVDGMSNDGTRDVIRKVISQNDAIELIDNPRRKKVYALNIAINRARGDYIAVFDAHAEYDPDYILNSIQILTEHEDVVCSGGPIVSSGSGAFARALAAAMIHPLGIGNARHRYPDYKGYVEGVGFPVFKKEIFEQIGGYDETFIHNHDDELYFRIARAGKKCFITPDARCRYFVRNDPGALYRQYFEYGRWRIAFMRKHGKAVSVRQLIPAIFFTSTFLTIVGAVFLLPGIYRLFALSLPALYIASLFAVASGLSARLGAKAALLFPVAASVMHFAYFAGFAAGCFSRQPTRIRNE